MPVHDEILHVGIVNGDDTELFVSRNLVVGSLFACDRGEEGISLAEQNMDLARRIGNPSMSALACFHWAARSPIEIRNAAAALA